MIAASSRLVGDVTNCFQQVGGRYSVMNVASSRLVGDNLS